MSTSHRVRSVVATMTRMVTVEKTKMFAYHHRQKKAS